MGTKADSAYIRQALGIADLNAVRVALYQMTNDPAVAALPVATKMSDADRKVLIDKATAWLEKNAGPGKLPEPPEGELRKLLNMATAEEMSDIEFEARRDLPAFKDFPWTTTWTKEKPKLPEGFKVAVIGSGFSGIAMAMQLELLGIPYIVIEKGVEPGGVWNMNRYPGVRVDTLSVTYEYSFEKDYKWDQHFGRGEEVRAYLTHISKKYGIFKNSYFNHNLKRSTFHEDKNTWTLEAESPEGIKKFEVNIIVTCVGAFANPKIVNFPGQETFKGQIIHPARWPAQWDPKGKNIAVIGNGSTGVQMVAPIAEDAKQVYVFQRTPQWISPREKYGQKVEPELNWLFDNFPAYWHWHRYMAIAALFPTHGLLLIDDEWTAKGGKVNPMQDKMRENLLTYMKKETGGREDLLKHLVPNYPPYVRRAVVDNGWYNAITKDHVELVTSNIKRFVPDGIETEDGKFRKVDVAVTATGFDVVQYLAPAVYEGVGGKTLQDLWAPDGPRAYLAMMAPGFPNMFMIYGPNGQPVSGGTGLPIWFVLWAGYIGQCLVRMLEGGKDRIEVTAEAYKRYNDELDAESSKMVMLRPENSPEKNYYVNKGRLQVNAPWSGPEFHRRSTTPDWNDIKLS